MSTITDAPGLPVDWLNGWLAAIGATVLVPGLQLAWSDDAIPTARFSTPGEDDLAATLAGTLPTEAELKASVIARERGGGLEFPRKVSIAAYKERARIERALHSTHLAASVSDLRIDTDLDELDHGAFDPSVPRGETLWSRAMACARALPAEHRRDQVARTLSGSAERTQTNGLGFDPRRLSAAVQASGAGSKVYVDPVVEILCFAALALFPTRGRGRRIFQRGWHDRATKVGAFSWVAWRPFLDRWAIDAFLDLETPAKVDVVTRYEVVPYQPGGDADVTRAYFARRAP